MKHRPFMTYADRPSGTVPHRCTRCGGVQIPDMARWVLVTYWVPNEWAWVCAFCDEDWSSGVAAIDPVSGGYMFRPDQLP